MNNKRENLSAGLVFKWIIDNSIEEGSVMEYQQKKVFYLFLGAVFLCTASYIFSMPLPDTIFYCMNATKFLVLLLFTILYFIKKIKVNLAFSVILSLINIEACIEIIYFSINNDFPFQRLFILVNIVMSVLYIMISVCAYMYKASIKLAVLSIASYVYCLIITNGPFLTSFFSVIIIIYIILPILGYLLNKNISSIHKEYTTLKVEEATLLKELQINRAELFAFAELASNGNLEEKNRALLNVFGETTKKNLYMAITSQMKEEKSNMEVLKAVFPELSPSELSICRLIVQDKTVGQICEILHRSSGNITSQRSNIRAKLKLEKNDNLKDVLLKRMGEFEKSSTGI